MPELPDVTLYVEHLERRVAGSRLVAVRVTGLNLLRTFDPTLGEVEGREVLGVRRLGKRIVIGLEGDFFLAVHLMIAGRLHWRVAPTARPPRGLATFEFASGTLSLTEAGTRQRAALHLVRGTQALARLDRGGIEVLEAGADAFRAALRREDHTLKRALTDPRLFSGIGNAYSDEILHHARLSPLRRTSQLDEAEALRLQRSAVAVLTQWIDRLRAQTGDAFPEKVTAFRVGMAVHGRYRQPCPACGAPVQRIVYAERETHYCARCQTQGRLLADRALSRLLKSDWPRTLEELEGVPAADSAQSPCDDGAPQDPNVSGGR